MGQWFGSMEKQYRYPGTRPFTENDRHLFFGRNNDIKQLAELIVLEKLVVLFSKSGYGKSSLLNAGVIPQLTENENHTVLNIRLNEQDRNPVELLIFHLKTGENKTAWLNTKFNLAAELPNNLAAVLWYYAKNIQLAQKNSKAITLVFDQFEELFNYNSRQVQEFSQTIATLLNLNMPEAVRLHMKQKLKNNVDFFTDKETDFLLEPLNLKVVFSLRNDRLSLLNQLKTFLPAVFKKTYELQPLDEMQALEALLEPAIKSGNFASPPFTYTNAATELILNSLKDTENQRIETFQLQLICQHAEELVISKTLKTTTAGETPAGVELTADELGKPEDIFEKHYKIINESLPQNQQHAARVLIEDKLIIGGNRVPLPETVITQHHNIASGLLKLLVDKRLLRSEPNTVGGTSYELSHDTLVAPIAKAAQVRRQREEEQEQIRIRNEELRIAKEKAAKDRRRLLFVVLALFFALSLSGIAVWKWIDAEQQKYIATEKTLEAQSNLNLANAKTEQLARQQKELENALEAAKLAKNIAEQQRIEAELAKNLANQQKQNAIALLKQELESKGIVVENLYEYYQNLADKQYAKGEYIPARSNYNRVKLLVDDNKLQSKINTKFLKIDVIENLLKQATNNITKKKFGTAIENYNDILKINNTDTITPFRIEFVNLLNNGYMVEVEGGKFLMGSNDGTSDETEHEVILNTFFMAKYEVTQHLYENVMGANANKSYFKDSKQNPVEMVDWYEAVEFCNKLSELIGLQPYYTINKSVIDKNNKYDYDTKKYLIEINQNSNGFRLPTEAEWEYAAGGGANNRTKWAGTNSENELLEYAWYNENSDSKTQPIGEKKPNQLGIYDLTGNVWEWCFDWYDDEYYSISPISNPLGASSGSGRVNRGGSWSNRASRCRVASRYDYTPTGSGNILGFRLVVVL